MSNFQKDPPPTNAVFADHVEEKIFDNHVEKFEYPPSQQQRANPEAERAVVRKLDWRVGSTSYFFQAFCFLKLCLEKGEE